MNKELIDRAWACLPREFKEKVKKEYYHDDTNPFELAQLEAIFGYHNLTSDEDGEEMLIISRKEVQEQYQMYRNMGMIKRLDALMRLFGSKCLPDELNEDNFAKSEPKPAAPKNEGTHQEQCVPQNAESGTYSLNHILKDDFREHNRLHIAAMAMQGILSNANRMKKYEYVATKPPCAELAVVVARNALRYADALIAEAEKGGEK